MKVADLRVRDCKAPNGARVALAARSHSLRITALRSNNDALSQLLAILAGIDQRQPALGGGLRLAGGVVFGGGCVSPPAECQQQDDAQA